VNLALNCHDPVRAFADPPLVDDAAELLASAPLHAIVIASLAAATCVVAPMNAKLRSSPQSNSAGYLW
jgi:maleate isomerase